MAEAKTDPSVLLPDQVYMSELMTVQATTLALQNQVDTVRNGDIIRNTAMGSAYSKWIANPAMGAQYKEMIDHMMTVDDNEYLMPTSGSDVSPAPKNNQAQGSTIGSALQMVQANQTFYNKPPKPPSNNS